MKEIIEKFVTIEKELSDEKGDFNLFALFLREDAGPISGIYWFRQTGFLKTNLIP